MKVLEALYSHIFVYFRRRRMNRFFAQFTPTPATRVLDIGGNEDTWTRESTNDLTFHITLLNTYDYQRPQREQFTPVIADATDVPFADRSFDVVYSNSVIEHVGSLEKQRAFAREARRLAPRLWIQTPARTFPIEPHLLALFVQYLPKTTQHRIARWTPRGILQPEVVHQIIDEVRLLSYAEMRELFPDCDILRERVFGITKSYIAVRGTGVHDFVQSEMASC